MIQTRQILISGFLFIIAVILGYTLDPFSSTDSEDIARQSISSGFDNLKGFLADILWLKMDDYHHMWMYQGNPWTTATDYLPHLWLVIKLNPYYADAYIESGYHVAINLEYPEEGMRILKEGLFRIQDNEELLWINAFVSSQTNCTSLRSDEEASWKYLRYIRRRNGELESPWNERNSLFLLGESFEHDSTRYNYQRISGRYHRRSNQI